MTPFYCFIVNLEQISHIVWCLLGELEQVNAGWGGLQTINLVVSSDLQFGQYLSTITNSNLRDVLKILLRTKLKINYLLITGTNITSAEWWVQSLNRPNHLIMIGWNLRNRKPEKITTWRTFFKFHKFLNSLFSPFPFSNTHVQVCPQTIVLLNNTDINVIWRVGS